MAAQEERKRRKIRMRANELTDADVSFISLVGRGAIRAPFRIIKSEGAGGDDNMIHLSKMFKAEEKAPEILAVVVASTAKNHPKLTDALKAEGFDVTSPQEIGDVTVFPQIDAELREDDATQIRIKLSDEFGIVLRDVSKGLNQYAEMTGKFSENIKKHGFYPGVMVATQVLNETLLSAAREADSPDTLSQTIEKAADDFKKYVSKLAMSLPESAFKLEKMKLEPIETKKEEPPKEEAKKEEVVVEPAKVEAKKEETKETVKVDTSEVKLLLEALMTKVDSQFTAIKATIDTVAAQAAAAVTGTQKLQEVLKGTVLGDPPGDATDSDANTDWIGGGRLIDTAMERIAKGERV